MRPLRGVGNPVDFELPPTRKDDRMYTPSPFKLTDPDAIWALVGRYPFAAMVAESLEIAHLPINRLSDGRLYGHVARANPVAKLAEGSAAVAVFSGPHAYISPLHYASDFNVPIWNYAAVHCRATLGFIDDQARAWDLLRDQVQAFEGDAGWQLPEEERFRRLVKGIRFFELQNPTLEATLKFNQNKTEADVLSVIAQLRQTDPPAADMMVSANREVHGEALSRSGGL